MTEIPNAAPSSTDVSEHVTRASALEPSRARAHRGALSDPLAVSGGGLASVLAPTADESPDASGIAKGRADARGFVVWLTGLSGAGKSTIAADLVPALRDRGRKVEVLDGDVVRTHLSKGLGFSREDRDLNIARIAFVAHLLARNDVAVVVAAISPYREARDAARRTIGDFVEVHVAPPLETCVARDVKGLYAKAAQGQVTSFTGVSDPYEPPLAPEVSLDTSRMDVGEAVERVLVALEDRGYLPRIEQ